MERLLQVTSGATQVAVSRRVHRDRLALRALWEARVRAREKGLGGRALSEAAGGDFCPGMRPRALSALIVFAADGGCACFGF